MQNLKDFYRYNKKGILIFLGIIFLFIIGLLIYFSSSKKENVPIVQVSNSNKIEKLVLFGNKEIVLEEGDNYVEPGYYAVTKSGEVKQREVEVTPNKIDTSKVGTYYINYVIEDKIEKRTIVIVPREEKNEPVDEPKESILSLNLKGESMMVLIVGERYLEPGYDAFDTRDGDLSDKVLVSGVVNTGIANTYKINYTVTNSLGNVETKTRTIIVRDSIVDLNISGNATSYTNKNVNLIITASGNNFSYVKYPNGVVSKNKNSTYSIEKNGTYTFLVYDNNLKYISKQVVVDKIDKTGPTGSCSATVSNGKTIYNVTSSDKESGINHYVFYGNSKELKNQTGPIFNYSSEITSGYVYVFDNANNSSKIDCNIIKTKNSEPVITENDPIKNDYLEMHFIVSGHNDDAILIRTGTSTIMIDGGRYNCYKNFVPYLKELGVTTIDAIIGSHPHYNHIQSQAVLIEKFKVKASYYSVDLNKCASKNYCDNKDVLYIKDAINKNHIPMYIKSVGDVITIGDVTIYILGPYKLNNTSKYKQNDNSFIFILKYKNNSFMFTGDADTNTFNYSKLKPYADKLGISLNVDMLKYPHHGNANLEDKLLNAMKPKYVIIPNYNYSQFPTTTNKNKLSKIGAKVYQNSIDGNIVLKSDGTNITVKTKQKAVSYKR